MYSHTWLSIEFERHIKSRLHAYVTPCQSPEDATDKLIYRRRDMPFDVVRGDTYVRVREGHEVVRYTRAAQVAILTRCLCTRKKICLHSSESVSLGLLAIIGICRSAYLVDIIPLPINAADGRVSYVRFEPGRAAVLAFRAAFCASASAVLAA